ncbi:MAG: TonB-dependent receptor [Gammaproteobacteria bacterium]|nr:MAG: TonB-dependent receptor [Gammaproteobacteria bacterium]
MINKNEQKFLKKKLPMYIKMASSVSLAVSAMGMTAHTFAAEAETTEEIVITGQRASIQSAQEIKKNSSVIVDSIVAEDIGKLPDRSVTEALQRVPGVTINRYDNMGDPEHFAGEGSGVAIRGLTQVRAELNGRDIFSAANGRGLSFEDVPAELMYAVDTYKSPSADMIEGGLGGTVNLRTRMPFDSAGQVASVTIKGNYGDQIKETNGEYSGLYSNRWTTDVGEFGFLVDLSTSDLSSRADNVYLRAYIPRTIDGETAYVPKGSDWRRNDFHRTRDGQYVAFQWAPNDSTEVYLTGFRSKHQQRWDENAFFIDQYAGKWTPVQTAAKDWQFDSNNSLVSGTTTTADAADGISFGTSTRYSQSVTTTSDYSTGIKWSPDDHWKFNADLQYVKSDADKEDYTLGLVVFPKTVAYSNLDGTPNIATDNSYMSDAANYSFGQMMSQPAKNTADSKAFRIEGEYSFDDSIIKSVKAGARFTDKSAENRESSQWVARYQPWQGYATATLIPKVTAAQASDYLTLYSFNNFQRGDANVPTSAYLIKSSLLNDFRKTSDAITAGTPDGCCAFNWDGDLNINRPDHINAQDEKTSAIFLMTNFAFEDLAMPLDGNIGVRAIKTENVAHGHLTYPTYTMPDNPNTVAVEAVQPFYAPAEDYDAKHSRTDILPSLNLRLKVTDDLFLRASASKAIWSPAFSDLKAQINLSANPKPGVVIDPTKAVDPSQFLFTSDVSTNPYLDPMKANQFDLSAEWYFDEHGGMAHVGLFRKDVEGFFRKSTGFFTAGDREFTTTWLGNVGEAKINGAEVGFSKFFDALPAPFDGLGIEANYTYIDSKTKGTAAADPVDTDNSTYGTLPMEGLSKNSYNIVGMYEKNGVSARLAYNWRSKYLVAVGPNGWNGNDNGVVWRLPVYNAAYGQLDASIGYTFLENYTVTFEASNLTKEVTEGIIDQNAAGDHTAYVYSQDVRYALSLRAKF